MKSGLLLLLLFVSLPTLAITKCKDADGKWHYGDIAVQECENSKVTTLDDRGFIKEQTPAPKSQAELDAEQQAIEQLALEEEKAKKAFDEQQRILNMYQNEEDIDRALEFQLASIDSNINIHQTYIKSLKSKVDMHQATLDQLKGDEKLHEQKRIEKLKLKINETTTQAGLLEEKKDHIQKEFVAKKKLFRKLKGIESAETEK